MDEHCEHNLSEVGNTISDRGFFERILREHKETLEERDERMDERAEALNERLDERFARQEEKFAAQLTETQRRLRELNHAHEQAAEKDRSFIGREAHDSFVLRTQDAHESLKAEIGTTAKALEAKVTDTAKALSDRTDERISAQASALTAAVDPINREIADIKLRLAGGEGQATGKRQQTEENRAHTRSIGIVVGVIGAGIGIVLTIINVLFNGGALVG